MTKQVAELRLREILTESPIENVEKLTVREAAKEIGCSTGLLWSLRLWKVLQTKLYQEGKKTRRGRRLKKVSLTEKMGEVVGSDGDGGIKFYKNPQRKPEYRED